MAGDADATAGIPSLPRPGEWLRTPAAGAGVRGRPSPAALAIALYVFCVASRVFELAPGMRLGLVVGAVVAAAPLLLPPRPLFRGLWTTPMAPLLALFGFAVVTFPVSSWPTGSLRHIVDVELKLVLAALLTAYAVRSVADVRAVLGGYLGAALWLEGQVLLFNVQERARVTIMYDTNDLGFVLCVVLPLAAYGVRSLRDPMSWLAMAVGALAIPVILATRSRGAFLTLLAIGGLLLLRLARARPALAAGALLAAVIGVAALAPTGYWQRIGTAWSAGETDDREYDAGGWVTARKHLWVAGVQLMLEHPLLGAGAGVFGETVHDGRGHLYYRAAHNSFLEIAGELGIGGLVLFVLMLVRAVRACRAAAASAVPEVARWAGGLEVSLYAYAIAGFALSQAYWLPLYVGVGTATALLRIARPQDARARRARAPRLAGAMR